MDNIIIALEKGYHDFIAYIDWYYVIIFMILYWVIIYYLKIKNGKMLSKIKRLNIIVVSGVIFSIFYYFAIKDNPETRLFDLFNVFVNFLFSIFINEILGVSKILYERFQKNTK